MSETKDKPAEKPKPKGPPVIAEIVTKLTDLLALAKIGEVQALAFVTVSDTAMLNHGRIEAGGYGRDLAVGVSDLHYATYVAREAIYADRVEAPEAKS